MADCSPEAANVVLGAIAESVVSPKIVPWELKDAKVRECLIPDTKTSR